MGEDTRAGNTPPYVGPSDVRPEHQGTTLAGVVRLRVVVVCALGVAGAGSPVAAAAPVHYEIGASIPGIAVEQVRPFGEVFGTARWVRSPDVWVRIRDTAVTSGEQEACVLRLRRAGAAETDPPLHEWRSPDAEEGSAPCSGLAPSGSVHLDGPWTDGTHTLELVAYGRTPATVDGKLLAKVDVGVDDAGPTIDWRGLPEVVPGGTTIQTIPDSHDLSGIWSTGRNVTDDLGRPVVVFGDGTAVVPPGRTLTLYYEAADGAGDGMTTGAGSVYPSNRSSATRTVRGLGTPVVPERAARPGAGRATSACSGAVVAGRWDVRARRLRLSGCRSAGAVRIQVRSVVRGRTRTRALRVADGTGAWARRVRTARGERPRRVRVRTSGSWTAWRTVGRG